MGISKKFILITPGVLLLLAGFTMWWWFDHISVAKYDRAITSKDLYQAALQWGMTPPPSASTPKALPWGNKVRLAIGGLGLPDDTQNGELGDLIAAQLGSSAGLELVERNQLDAVLEEQKLSLSGLVRAKDAVAAGKLLRADWFLLGTAAQVHGTNCLVLRLVDTRTGITRDGTVLVVGSLPGLAAATADFVRQEREAAAEAKPRVYLAIGTFQDLSVNDRQAGFPAQLRGYLTAAYQHGRYTLLEREYADLLLQEMQLDLAGLSGNTGAQADAPAPLQSAFWLVDGCFESYETTNFQVDLTLEVHRIFSTSQQVTVRGLPGEPVCRAAKAAIDGVLNQNPGFVVPTLLSEVRNQMAAGRNLTQFGRYTYGGWLGAPLQVQHSELEARNLREAMRAFQTVLLLEPTNREAKLYLALCLLHPDIGRTDEGRAYFRQLLDESTDDKWGQQTEVAVQMSYGWSDEEQYEWYKACSLETTNPAAADFYRRQAESARQRWLLRQAGSTAQILAEQGLFQSVSNELFANIYGRTGVESFLDTYGTNQAAAAARLASLYPQLRTQYPEYAPYLLAAVVSGQVDTNAPVVAEFQSFIDQAAAHPEKVYRAVDFWSHVPDPLSRWGLEHKDYRLADAVLEVEARIAPRYYPMKFPYSQSNEEKMRLAYARLGLADWRGALDIFETYSNLPVYMGGAGPWGPAFTMIYSEQEAAKCREKLGLPVTHDPREFKLGGQCLCLCTPSTFSADKNGLWVGISDQLIHLDFELRTNLAVTLPKSPDSPVTALGLDDSAVWVGTDGDGLIKYDKATGQIRQWKEGDGLLMNNIRCLDERGNRLWIGYGVERTDGGLGCLELPADHIISFSPPISDSSAPTRFSVNVMAAGPADDVWYSSDNGLQARQLLQHFRIHDNVSERLDVCGPASSLAFDGRRLALGQIWRHSQPGPAMALGVGILDVKTGRQWDLKATPGLPAGMATALTFDGDDLWVGGICYVALVNPDTGTIRKFAYVPAPVVDRIQVGGGYVWVQYDHHLHRARLE